MTQKQWSEIQRQLGYIEGLAMGEDTDTGSTIADAVAVLDEMLKPF